MFSLVDLNMTYRPKTAIFSEFSIKKINFPLQSFQTSSAPYPRSPPPLPPLVAPSTPDSAPPSPIPPTLSPYPPVHPSMMDSYIPTISLAVIVALPGFTQSFTVAQSDFL